MTRYMLKIRFNPTVRQRPLWDTSDLDDPRVAAELRAWFPWYEQATGRLGPYNRVLLWWALTGGRQLRPRPLGDRVANRTQEAAR